MAEEATPTAASVARHSTEEGASSAPPPGRSRFWQRISAYEPTYVLLEPVPAGNRPVNLKFQISVAFQVLGKDEEPRDGDDRTNGLYGAFSQTAFWDLESESKPFLDTNYRADVFWHQGLSPGVAASDGLAIEGGLGHESNGKLGRDSRSFNIIFIRPMMRWDLHDGWWVRLSPRLHHYLDTLLENPQIARYRGYANLDAALGARDGLSLAVRGRIGDHWDRGSLELNLSYPLDRITGGWAHGFAYLQGFSGWSETLLGYDQRVEQPRILLGIAITR